MAIPDFQSIFLPLLRYFGDGKPHAMNEAIEAMVAHFSLSEEEQEALLPSGRMTVVKNRTHWAKTYLKKAGLLFQTERGGAVQISERGRQLLDSSISDLRVKRPEAV